jgi:hypothetical protein
MTVPFSRNGQNRGILRGAAATAQDVNATVSVLSLDPGLERLTSRGIPDPEDWIRQKEWIGPPENKLRERVGGSTDP